MWDFDKLHMEFTINGRKFVLRGAKTPSIKLTNNKSFAPVLNKGVKMCFLCASMENYSLILPTFRVMTYADKEYIIPFLIAHFSVHFEDIFTEPTRLPWAHPGFDHKIPINEGTQPFIMKPYRFPLMQKDVIDKIVNEMLTQGINEVIKEGWILASLC